MRPVALVLACAVLTGGVVRAQAPTDVLPQAPAALPGPSMPGVSDEARAAAREMAEASGAIKITSNVLGLMRNQLVANLQRSTSKPAEEVARIVDEVLLPEMRGHVGELADMVVEINAANYTVDEMRQLTAFYRTPLGQRVVEVTPKVGTQSFMAGQAWGARVAQDAFRKNAEELRRRGITL